MPKWQLVADASQAWKWFSMQAMAINTAFLATWALVPEKFQNSISERWIFGIAISLLLLGMVGRLTKQREPIATPEIPAAEKLSE